MGKTMTNSRKGPPHCGDPGHSEQNKASHNQRYVISAVIHEGLEIRMANGADAVLAVLDEHGRIIGRGDEVARKVFDVSVESYRNFLKGEGFLRARSEDDLVSHL